MPPSYGEPPAYGASPSYEASSYAAPSPPPYGVAAGAPYGAGCPPASGSGLPPGWEFATYGSRVLAYLLDGLYSLLCTLPVLVVLIPLIVATTPDENGDPPGWIFLIVGPLFILSWFASVRNSIWHTGTRGQSWGKKTMGIWVLKDGTMAPIGGGMGIVRYLVIGLVSQFTCGIVGILDVLWPLWDPRRQALHDKIVSSVVVRRVA